MSIYDLAATPDSQVRPLIIVKRSANLSDDDPQNTVVYGGQSSAASIVVSPYSSFGFDDEGTSPPPAVVINTQPAEIKTAITKLARFIPTESITIYLAAVSTVAAISEASGGNSVNQTTENWIMNILAPVSLYWITGLIVTPAIFLLIRAIAQMKLNKKPFSEFPIWKLLASIIAFLIWALAIPNNPYADSAAAKSAFAFLAIVISIFLDLFDQFYEERKLRAAINNA